MPRDAMPRLTTDRSTTLPDFSDDELYRRFEFLVNAPALYNAVTTAAELDVFGFLARNTEATAEQLREFTGVPAHQLRVLLQAVCATGLLRRQDGRYVNSDVAERLLASDEPDSWRHILIGWKEIYYPAFADMTTAVRAGTNTALARFPGEEPTLYQRLSHRSHLETVFHKAMAAFTLQSIPDLLEHADMSSVGQLLDVGGGDGVTTAHLLERYPELRVTVFDLPSVTARAEELTSGRFGDRVRFQPGDLFTDEFPQGVDAVLFSHVLEIFTAEQITTLLTKAYHALAPGGTVFVYGFHISDDETTGMFSARLSLYLNVLASGQGMAYPVEDYQEWLRRAGFSKITTIERLAFEHGLTMGVRG